jgi:hypothetical protein
MKRESGIGGVGTALTHKTQFVVPWPKRKSTSVLMIKAHAPFIDCGKRDVGHLKPAIKIYSAIGFYVNSSSDIALLDHDLEVLVNKVREWTCSFGGQPSRLIMRLVLHGELLLGRNCPNRSLLWRAVTC